MNYTGIYIIIEMLAVFELPRMNCLLKNFSQTHDMSTNLCRIELQLIFRNDKVYQKDILVI